MVVQGMYTVGLKVGMTVGKVGFKVGVLVGIVGWNVGYFDGDVDDGLNVDGDRVGD